MEIMKITIYIILIAVNLLVIRLAYYIGQRVGRTKFINKLNKLTVSNMLEHKRNCFKKL